MRFSCSNIIVCYVRTISVISILSISGLSPVWAQNTHAQPSAYSPAGIVALDEAIRAELAQGKVQAAWDLARQHIDFQYMPPEMLLQIAKLAAQVQSPERALAIIQRALQSFPEYGPLHAYGLSLARYLNNCSFAQIHQAYYQHPRKLAWRQDFIEFQKICGQRPSPASYYFSVDSYRGHLPHHDGHTDTVHAEPGSFVADFCAVYENICPASREFTLAEQPPAKTIVKTRIGARKKLVSQAHFSTELHLQWQHYQAGKLAVFADDITIGLRFDWRYNRAKYHRLELRGGRYDSQPPALQSAYHSQHIGTEYSQIYPRSEAAWPEEGILAHLDRLRPASWGWKMGYVQHLRPQGSLSVYSLTEFQSWQIDKTRLHLSFSREQLDYPASALAGDGTARHWQIKVNHPFSGGLADGWIKEISLGYIHSVTGYRRALPWLRYPHQIARTTSSVELGFPEIGFSLLPSIRVEQISSQSRNSFDAFDETRFSVSFSKAF